MHGYLVNVQLLVLIVLSMMKLWQGMLDTRLMLGCLVDVQWLSLLAFVASSMMKRWQSACDAGW